MMIKRFFCFALPLLLLLSCKNNKGGDFTVTGTFRNADKLASPLMDSNTKGTVPLFNKIYLQEVSYGKQQAPVLQDSVKVSGNSGKFELHGSGKGEKLYVVIFGDNLVPVPLVNDSKELTLDVDLGRQDNFYTVTGSPASKQLQQLIDGYNSKNFYVSKLFSKIDSLKTVHAPDSTLVAVTNEKNNAITDLNNFLHGYINNPAAATIGILALSWSNNSFTKQEFESSLASLQQKYPANADLKKIKSSYDAQQAQAAQSNAQSWVGKSAPDLALPDVNGHTVSLSSFRGKYVLVDFWASWCGPCRQENPNVVKAYNEFKNKNFTIVGVSLDREKDPWLKAIKDDNLSWTHISDLLFWNSKAVQTFGFEGIPFNVLIDPQGKIIAQELRGEALEQELASVLK